MVFLSILQFPPTSQNTPVGRLDGAAYYPRCIPISHSQDTLQIHHNYDQDKVVTVDEWIND